MNNTSTLALNWNNLIVIDAEGDTVGTLGDVVANCPANLDNAVLNDEGAIAEWEGYMLNEEGQPIVDHNGFETLNNDAVNWNGLREALGR